MSSCSVNHEESVLHPQIAFRLCSSATHPQALITTDYVLVLNAEEEAVVGFIEELQRRLAPKPQHPRSAPLNGSASMPDLHQVLFAPFEMARLPQNDAQRCFAGSVCMARPAAPESHEGPLHKHAQVHAEMTGKSSHISGRGLRLQ